MSTSNRHKLFWKWLKDDPIIMSQDFIFSLSRFLVLDSSNYYVLFHYLYSKILLIFNQIWIFVWDLEVSLVLLFESRFRRWDGGGESIGIGLCETAKIGLSFKNCPNRNLLSWIPSLFTQFNYRWLAETNF